MLETFTMETFAPLLHTPFQLVLDAEHQWPLELSEVKEVTGGGPADPLEGQRRTPFSLLFHGPRQPVLPQRIYRLEHATMGTFDLFLVPLGPDAQGMRYEAIFT